MANMGSLYCRHACMHVHVYSVSTYMRRHRKHICIYIYTHTCTHVCVCKYVFLYIVIHIHTYVHTYIRTYIHTYILTYMPTYIQAYMHIHLHMLDTDTYTCMHIPLPIHIRISLHGRWKRSTIHEIHTNGSNGHTKKHTRTENHV